LRRSVGAPYHMALPEQVKRLIDKGVRITAPFSIEIGDDVLPERISGEGVVLHTGTKIYGAKTLISPGVILGSEAPATLIDCHVGPGVSLKGGCFQASVFLEGVSIASGAQVREGSLLEEEVKVGHTVGLKQSVLFPFVTLGSLINFCDCLMAGGTGRDNHSEVGSSFIHFNYSPQQDKATPSLIGDVPRGVMLDQRPIFLGGQGGLVGPLRIDYGTVTTAGTIWRHDSFGAKLLHGGASKQISQTFNGAAYGDIGRKVFNNIMYIANILALRQWYVHVRRPYFLQQKLGQELYTGAVECIDMMMQERLHRFREFSRKVAVYASERHGGLSGGGDIIRRQREFGQQWPAIEAAFADPEREPSASRDAFCAIFPGEEGLTAGSSYINSIRKLDEDAGTKGCSWLQQSVNDTVTRVTECLPSFSSVVV
jgi:bifunctional UDP-N-acetylglucosamine pyrophosphorylase / glucosamine-1-phosphate N-acetyltransferase